MRTIDADKIPYTMLYKENWLKGSGVEAQGVWKEDIDAMPTIEPERKTGRWIPIIDQNGQHFICEFCGEWRYHTQQKYCGECGRKLKMEVEHEAYYKGT